MKIILLLIILVLVSGCVSDQTKAKSIIDGDTFVIEASSPEAPHHFTGGMFSKLTDIDGDGFLELLVAFKNDHVDSSTYIFGHAGDGGRCRR